MALSQEVNSIIFVENHQSDLSHITTSIYRPGAPDYHGYYGTNGWSLAVDWGAIGNNSAMLLKIQKFFWDHYRNQVTELIGPNVDQLVWAHPGKTKTFGRGCVGIYGQTVVNDHKDHVHIAVPKGTFLQVASTPTTIPPAREGFIVAQWHNEEFVAIQAFMYQGKPAVAALKKDGSIFCEPSAAFQGGFQGDARFRGPFRDLLGNKQGNGYTAIGATDADRYAKPEGTSPL